MPLKPDIELPIRPAGKLPPIPVLKRYFPDEASRRQRVGELFDTTASHYDWITQVMSFGSGRWYRQDALRRHGLSPGMRHLDVGAGTGVIALLGQQLVGSSGLVIALDPSLPMLEIARRAGVGLTLPGRGESLPCADSSFDFLSMGYALRHVHDLAGTFKEYARVLRPGGRVLILEITAPPRGWRRIALRFYMKRIVPAIALLLRRSPPTRRLMQFYWDTIEHCVPPEQILGALRGAGLDGVRRTLTLGIFSEYTAEKPAAAH